MQIQINPLSAVDYELEIDATPADLAVDFNKALRDLRAKTTLRGFRPGKVPLTILKKRYGKALAYDVASKFVQDVYETEVLDEGTHDVLGQPKITELDLEVDGPLHAVIRFGVRPSIELKDLSKEQVTKLVHPVSDEDVEEEIKRLQQKFADLVPLDEEAAGEEDYVVVDMELLDDETGESVEGTKEEDLAFFLNDPRIKDELKEALVGTKEGDVLTVDIIHEGEHHDHEEDIEDLEIVDTEETEVEDVTLDAEAATLEAEEGTTDAEADGAAEAEAEAGEEAHAHTHTHPYQVTVKEVKRQELPEMDEEFFSDATEGVLEEADEEAFRAHLRKSLSDSWSERSQNYLQNKLMERMKELHPLPIPESVVEFYLDAYIEDVKRRNEGNLPEGFDEENFRKQNEDDAKDQAHWMLLRDHMVKEFELEVDEDERLGFFGDMTSEESSVTAEQMLETYTKLDLLDSLDRQIIDKKLFALLEEKFEIVEKDREALEKEMEERRAALEAEMQAVEATQPDPDADDAEVEAEAVATDDAEEATDEADKDA